MSAEIIDFHQTRERLRHDRHEGPSRGAIEAFYQAIISNTANENIVKAIGFEPLLAWHFDEEAFPNRLELFRVADALMARWLKEAATGPHVGSFGRMR